MNVKRIFILYVTTLENYCFLLLSSKFTSNNNINNYNIFNKYYAHVSDLLNLIPSPSPSLCTDFYLLI